MNIKQKQSIIDAAPEGAEYYTENGCYYRNVKDGNYEYSYSMLSGWHTNKGRPKHRYYLLANQID